ncbi:hypothetical protein V3565_02505 [Bartonella sp. B10]
MSPARVAEEYVMGGVRKILATTWIHKSELIRNVKGTFRSIVEIHISLLPEWARAVLLMQ